MGTKTMTISPDITLEEIADTDLGREIIGQRDAKVKADTKETETARKRQVKTLQERAEKLVLGIDAGREEVTEFALNFVDAFDALDARYSDLREVRSRLRSLGETLVMPETRVKEPEVRQLIERIQAMARRIGRPL